MRFFFEEAMAMLAIGCLMLDGRGTALRLESAPGMTVLDLVVKPLARDSLLESSSAPAVVVYLNDCRRPGMTSILARWQRCTVLCTARARSGRCSPRAPA
jgi:hypothetical protein